MTTSVLLTGVGGQGTILAGDVVAKVAVAAGLDVKLSEVHGMSQRGGSVDTVVRFGEEVFSPLLDAGNADVLVGFELLEAARWVHYLAPGGRAYANARAIAPLSVMIGDEEYPEDIEAVLEARGVVLLDADALACEAGSPRSANIVMLGALSMSLDFDEVLWLEVVGERVPSRTVEENLKAFGLGREACSVDGRCV